MPGHICLVRAPPLDFVEMIYWRMLFYVFGNNLSNNFSIENEIRLKNNIVFLFLLIRFKQIAAYNMTAQMSCDVQNNTAITIWMILIFFNYGGKSQSGPISMVIFPSQLKFDAIYVSLSSQFEQSDVSKCWTWRDSYAAAVCAEVCSDLTHLALDKWLPFRRRYFQKHFHECKILYFDKNFTVICS